MFFSSFLRAFHSALNVNSMPKILPLAMMTMKTQTHGFLNFYPHTVGMGLCSAALRATGELRYKKYLVKSRQYLNLESILSFSLCNIPKSLWTIVGEYFKLFVLLNQEITLSKKDLDSSHSTKECRMESDSLQYKHINYLFQLHKHKTLSY